jgi:hypothetical protein
MFSLNDVQRNMTKLISRPAMHYPLEFELERIGGWTNPAIRLGGEKCDCSCKHENQCEFCSRKCTGEGYIRARPSTLYERLKDCRHVLDDLTNWLKMPEYRRKLAKERLDKIDWEQASKVMTFNRQQYNSDLDLLRLYNSTLKTIRVSHSILKHQVQAYRKVLFHDEHRLIYSDCPICKEKRFFYRLPNMQSHVYPEEYFDVKLDELNTMFHCMECHYVDYENNLDTLKIKHKSKGGLSEYLESKSGMRMFLQKQDLYMRVVSIGNYYIEREPDLKKLSIEEFFITVDHPNGGIGYQCPACKFIYKRENMAEKHLKYFWKRGTKNWINGCMRGIQNKEKQEISQMV